MRLNKIIIVAAIIFVVSYCFYAGSKALNTIKRLKNRFEQSQIAVAKAYINNNLKTALRLYQLDNGFYPTPQQGLRALFEKPASAPLPEEWNGPYIEKELLDPWGRPYGYELVNRDDHTGMVSCRLFSYGPDGIASQDDIPDSISYREKLPEALQAAIKEKFKEASSHLANIKILDFEPTDNCGFFLEGESISMSKVFSFVTALEEALLFENVRTEETRAGKVKGIDVATFKIRCRIPEEVITDEAAFRAALDDLKTAFKNHGLFNGASFDEEIERRVERRAGEGRGKEQDL